MLLLQLVQGSDAAIAVTVVELRGHIDSTVVVCPGVEGLWTWGPGGSLASVEARPPSAAAAARPALPPRGGMCWVVKRQEHGGIRGTSPQSQTFRFLGRECTSRPVKRADTARKGRNAPIRVAADPWAAAEAGLLDVAQLSGVVGRCYNVPQNVGWIADWVPQPRGPIQRDPAPSRLRGGRRETKKVIARGEGYTYIAALRSPDLRHTTNEKETPLLLW
jgi:hypothetical protein